MNPFLFLRRLLELLGIWSDPESPKVKIPKLQAEIKQYEKDRAASENKLKDFEREISELEAEIKTLIEKILTLPEGSKSRVLQEKNAVRQNKLLENTFNLNDLIFSTLDTYDTVIVQTRALILAIENNAPDVETLTDDLKDKIGELKAQQKEIARLENTRYESPVSSSQVDLAAIMNNVGMTAPAASEPKKTTEPTSSHVETPKKIAEPMIETPDASAVTNAKINEVEKKLNDL